MAVTVKRKTTTTTGNQLLIIDSKDTSDYRHIQFYPNNLEVSRSLDLTELKAIGNSLPKYLNIGGNIGSVSFSFNYVSDEANKQDVVRDVSFFEARMFRHNKKSGVRTVLLHWGGNSPQHLFKNYEYIIKDVKVSYKLFDAKNNHLPMLATVSLQLVHTSIKQLFYNDIIYE